MNRDDILRMAREAGFITGTRDYADGDGAMPFVQSVATGTFLPELERFHALATERERTARQAAQSENEELKARIARSGVEHRKEMAKAVRAMREVCARECDSVYHQHIGPQYGEVRHGIAACAAAIRAIGNAPDLRPDTADATDSPSVAAPDQQIETLVTPGNTPPTTPTP